MVIGSAGNWNFDGGGFRKLLEVFLEEVRGECYRVEITLPIWVFLFSSNYGILFYSYFSGQFFYVGCTVSFGFEVV